jgi:hypothetical protein
MAWAFCLAEKLRRSTDYILHACSRTDMALTPWLSVVRAQNADETSICQCIR